MDGQQTATATRRSTTIVKCLDGHDVRLIDGGSSSSSGLPFTCSGCGLGYDGENARVTCCRPPPLATDTAATARDDASASEGEGAAATAHRDHEHFSQQWCLGCLMVNECQRSTAMQTDGDDDGNGATEAASPTPGCGLSRLPPFPQGFMPLRHCPRCASGGNTSTSNPSLASSSAESPPPIVAVFPCRCAGCGAQVEPLGGYQCLKCPSSASSNAASVSSSTSSTPPPQQRSSSAGNRIPSIATDVRAGSGRQQQPFAVCASCILCRLHTDDGSAEEGGGGSDSRGGQQRENNNPAAATDSDGAYLNRRGRRALGAGNDNNDEDTSENEHREEGREEEAATTVTTETTAEPAAANVAALESIFAQQMLTLRQQLEHLATSLSRQELAAPDCNPTTTSGDGGPLFRIVECPTLRCPMRKVHPSVTNLMTVVGLRTEGGGGSENNNGGVGDEGGDATLASQPRHPQNNNSNPQGLIVEGGHALRCSHYGRLPWSCEECGESYAPRCVGLQCRACRYDRCMKCLTFEDGIVPLCPVIGVGGEGLVTKGLQQQTSHNAGENIHGSDQPQTPPATSTPSSTHHHHSCSVNSAYHNMSPNAFSGPQQCVQCLLTFGLWQGYVCGICEEDALLEQARREREEGEEEEGKGKGGGVGKKDDDKQHQHQEVKKKEKKLIGLCVSCAMENHNEANRNRGAPSSSSSAMAGAGVAGEEGAATSAAVASSTLPPPPRDAANKKQPFVLAVPSVHPQYNPYVTTATATVVPTGADGDDTPDKAATSQRTTATTTSYTRCACADDCTICLMPCDTWLINGEEEGEDNAEADGTHGGNNEDGGAHDPSAIVITEEVSKASLLESPYPAVRLSCPGQHVFHCQCIAAWLQTNQVCPVCRVDISGRW